MIRIGNGFDVHAFGTNRKLILGGVEIPYELGLVGHSDADVLCHAIADSFLGSLSLGDIGKFFPDDDPQYKGMSSLLLLKQVYGKIESLGYKLVNLDSTIICQKPKLAPFIETMRETITEALSCGVDSVGVKATTTEQLGFTGRNEGIAVMTVTLIQKK